MPLVDLVSSVPDLHTARILASAGVSYISFLQTTPDLNEIISWIEGPEVLVQLTDPDLPIPRVNGLIIPFKWYDQYSFMDKKIFWITEKNNVHVPEGVIYTDPGILPPSLEPGSMAFYPYSILKKYNPSNLRLWIDFEQDLTLFEYLFLD